MAKIITEDDKELRCEGLKEGKADMRRNNRKNSIKKERIIMLASSAFVLTALTMTGIYMKNSNKTEKDDGYTLDFSAMEDNADDKFEEIAQADDGSNQVADNSVQNQTGNTTLGNTGIQDQTGNTTLGNTGLQENITEDDLDYMPLEAGSGQVEIPGLTNQSDTLLENEAEEPLIEDAALSAEQQAAAEENADKAASAQNVVVEKTLDFAESDGLLRPVSGEILMSYSMDKSIYFATLDQYKYNPAVIFSAAQGAEIVASAEGKVVGISSNEETGRTVTLDLGNGYQAVYGQLDEIKVKEGAYVSAGDKLGVVAAPTKYYSTEGSNLYFQLMKDGSPVNPEGLFQ